MESIHLNALFHSDEHKWNELYQSLYNSPLTHVLAFDIHPAKSQRHYPAFFYYTEELMQTTISLMSQMNELTKIANRIPAIAIEAFQRACLIEEIKSSNDIEGVNSTRKEISQALDAQDNISVAETTRLWSTVNKYIKLQNKQDISFSNSSDLRKFYDEFILDEIRRDDPKNIPDGEIFRKSSVEVWSICRLVLRFPIPWTNCIPCSFCRAFNLRRSFFSWCKWITLPYERETEKSSLALFTKSGSFSRSLAWFFWTDFFQTNLYLLAADSIFVPSCISKFYI